MGQLGSRAEAEDAVQTTFVYALRALRRGVVPENEAAWLTAIAKNVCHWQRRTLARRGPLSADLDLDTIALARPEPDEEGRLFGLEDALASIPEKQREALLLREWRGLAPREIATELGISGPATHALLTRARHSLARALTLPARPAAGIAWLVFELRVPRQGAFRRRLGEGGGGRGGDRERRRRRGRRRADPRRSRAVMSRR